MSTMIFRFGWMISLGLVSGNAIADAGFSVRGTHAAYPAALRIAGADGVVDYAIITTATGTAFVDVTDATSPSEVGFIPGPNASHRDVTVLNGTAYVSDDGSGGVSIIDLQTMPPSLVGVLPGVATALTVTAELATQRLYVAGTESGLHVFDVSAPQSPVAILPTPFDDFPISDVSVRFGWVYAATGNALAILNASLLPSLNLFAWINYPDANTVSARLADDIATAVAIDVTSTGGILRTLDVFDPRRVVSVAVNPHVDATGAVPSAMALAGDDVFVAWRDGGLEVRDLSDRQHLERIASFGTDAGLDVVDVDVSLGTDRVLCLPASGSLTILALEDGYGRLEGVVIDQGSMTGERGVVVSVAERNKESESDGQGDYHLNLAPGDVTVTFTRFGFDTQTLPATIVDGQTTTLDVAMQREPTGFLQGTAFQSGREDVHPEGTIVRLLHTPLSVGAPLSGDYLVPDVPVGTYVAEVDRFGYDTVQSVVTIAANTVTHRDFILPSALIADNFETDTGWTTADANDTATTGRWTREVPVGTGAGYVQPLRDETPDPANTALITGNGPLGGWIGDADVDDGVTIATSPPYDLTQVSVPILRFYAWFSVDARWEGEVPGGDDRLVVDMSNDGGASWATLRTIRDSQLFWQQFDFVIDDHLSATDDMRLRFRVFDEDPPSIVEAAVDDLELFSGFQMIELPHHTPILPHATQGTPGGMRPPEIHPNPASGRATFAFTLPRATRITLDVFDVAGRRVARLLETGTSAGPHTVTWPLTDYAGRPVPSGVYWYRFSTPKVTTTSRIIVTR